MAPSNFLFFGPAAPPMEQVLENYRPYVTGRETTDIRTGVNIANNTAIVMEREYSVDVNNVSFCLDYNQSTRRKVLQIRVEFEALRNQIGLSFRSFWDKDASTLRFGTIDVVIDKPAVVVGESEDVHICRGIPEQLTTEQHIWILRALMCVSCSCNENLANNPPPNWVDSVEVSLDNIPQLLSRQQLSLHVTDEIAILSVWARTVDWKTQVSNNLIRWLGVALEDPPTHGDPRYDPVEGMSVTNLIPPVPPNQHETRLRVISYPTMTPPPVGTLLLDLDRGMGPEPFFHYMWRENTYGTIRLRIFSQNMVVHKTMIKHLIKNTEGLTLDMIEMCHVNGTSKIVPPHPPDSTRSCVPFQPESYPV